MERAIREWLQRNYLVWAPEELEDEETEESDGTNPAGSATTDSPSLAPSRSPASSATTDSSSLAASRRAGSTTRSGAARVAAHSAAGAAAAQ